MVIVEIFTSNKNYSAKLKFTVPGEILAFFYTFLKNMIKLESKKFQPGGIEMIFAELRKKSQITIPKDIVVKLGLKEGDLLEIEERDGQINIIPVKIYPKKYIQELKEEIKEIKYKIESGEQAVFETVDEMFKYLDDSED